MFSKRRLKQLRVFDGVKLKEKYGCYFKMAISLKSKKAKMFNQKTVKPEIGGIGNSAH